jgi:hypothetical protein
MNVTDDLLVSGARSEENLRHLRVLGMKSLMTAPICARGRILGAIKFVSSSESRRFTGADLSLAEDLGESGARWRSTMPPAPNRAEARCNRAPTAPRGGNKSDQDEFLATVTSQTLRSIR